MARSEPQLLASEIEPSGLCHDAHLLAGAAAARAGRYYARHKFIDVSAW